MRQRLLAVLTAAVAVTVIGPSDAQAQSRGDKYYGVQAGASLSSFINEVAVTDSRWGFTGGLFAGMRPQRNMGLTLEANWVQKGVKESEIEGSGVRLDYIQVPFTVSGGGGGFGAYIGLGIGFKVGCSAASQLTCDSAKSTEWTMPFGLMYQAQLDNGKLIGFDIRYDLGLSDVFENSSVRNRAWLFRVQFGGVKGP